MIVVRGGFVIEGGDKLFVEARCFEGRVSICVLGRGKLPYKPRRLPGVYDRLIMKTILERGVPLECREIRCNRLELDKTRYDGETYYVLRIYGDREIEVYFPLWKLDFIKKCIAATGKR